MGKLSLATRLADEIGSSTDEAMRFIDEVGMERARSVVDEAAESASKTVENWWRPTAIGGTLVGGGALAWRQQDLEQAQALANQQQDYTSAVQAIMESDLPPEKKQEMIDQLLNNAPASGGNNGNGGDDGGDDGGGGLLGTDVQTTIVLLVVLAFAFRYTLGGDE
jgi:hypothetical protein